jgi:hypothetical protein
MNVFENCPLQSICAGKKEYCSTVFSSSNMRTSRSDGIKQMMADANTGQVQ